VASSSGAFHFFMSHIHFVLTHTLSDRKKTAKI
jgi:hypothetical protein